MTELDELFNNRPELAATDSQLSRISELMVREEKLRSDIETYEAILADLKERNSTIRRVDLPLAMAESGVTEFTCAETKTKAKLTFECDGALGSDPAERERKIEILIGAGAEEIVKMECVAAFGKGEYERAVNLSNALGSDHAALIKRLKEMYNGKRTMLDLDDIRTAAEHLEATTKIVAAAGRTIHHQTLKSWVKERMEAGDNLPLQEIGLWYGQVAKVARPKK